MKWNRRSHSATHRISALSRACKPVIEPLEDRQLMSLTVDLRLANGTSSAAVTSVGQVLDLDVYAVVSGKTAGANDGLQSVTGSMLGTVTATGGVIGNFSNVNVTDDYTANGASDGTIQDLNGDGGLDVGSNNNSLIDGFFNARAAGIEQDGTISGDSQTFLIATAQYTVKTLGTGVATDLNFRVRDISGGSFEAVWEEDSKYLNDEDGTLAVGSPIVLTGPKTVSNNASLSGTVSKVASGSTSGFSGATVYLDNNNSGTLDSGDVSTTTNSSGGYSFSGLAAGTYHVREVLPSGYTLSAPSGGVYTISLAASQSASGYNFTDTAVTATKGSISGTLDKVVSGVTSGFSGVTMFIDSNNNGVHDSGEYEVTTTSTGSFTFINEAAGTYHIRELTVPSGYTLTSPSSGSDAVTLTSGGSVTGVVFVDTANGSTAKGTISGTVTKVLNGVTSAYSGLTMFIDTNNNGVHDPGEYEVTTTSTGSYTFINEVAGTYHVRQLTVPTGYTVTTPSSAVYTVVLTAGQAATGYNFVDSSTTSAKGSIAGTLTKTVSGKTTDFSGVVIYIDTNDNGQHDQGEYESTTNSAGQFSFINLAAGTYYIREIVPSGYKVSSPSVLYYKITLAAGQSATGYVFNDANT